MQFSLLQRATLVCLCFATTLASADSLSLEQAVIRALEHNPELAVFAVELRAQEGRVTQAAARPAPEVGVLVENALGSGARSDFEAAETTLSVGMILERGARERRQAAALAESNLLNADLRVRRADVAAETARRFVAVLERQQLVMQVRHARELTAQTLAAVQARVRAAKVPEAEEARAQAQLARAQLDEEHAEHQLLTGRRALVALWGESEASFAEATGALNELPVLRDFDALRAEIQNNPEFERFASESRVREAELRVAELRRTPPWHLSAGVRRFEDGNDHAFVIGLTVPLPSRDYVRGAVDEAHARVDAVDAKRNARRNELDAELYGLYQELKHAYAEVTTLRDTVAPKMERAAEESRYAYERGRYSYLEWVAAQRESLDARGALTIAYADAHRYRIEIERLTGISLAALPSR